MSETPMPDILIDDAAAEEAYAAWLASESAAKLKGERHE